MISNYDLISLGFNPKYKGFSLLREAINLKIKNFGLSTCEIFRKINPDHPQTVEKNIRVCLMGSDIKSKYVCLSVTKTIENLSKYAIEKTNKSSLSISFPKVKFEKVSFKQFKKDVLDCGFKFEDNELRGYYDAIRLPRRATTGSAGYDFFAPFDLVIEKGKTLKFPTGIKCFMEDGVVLTLFPRSGLGFKYGMQLYNTCGVIDSDYMMAKNEGHIHAKFHFINDEVENIVIGAGSGYMQGILLPFIKTVDDETDGVRVGGFGSTNGKL
jgi:dUTP pyrophosphatase